MSHITLAHHFWKLHLKPHESAIDATCGNGHDTLFLTTLLPQGTVIGLDLQKQAIDQTQTLLDSHQKKVFLYHQSHVQFPENILPKSVALIVYNLGYLPGSDKKVKTEAFSTLQSLKAAFPLLQQEGMISITAYPGHLEGEKERDHLLNFLLTLDPLVWGISHHRWLSSRKKPELFIIKNLV